MGHTTTSGSALFLGSSLGRSFACSSVPFGTLEQAKDLPKELPKNKALPLVVVCPTGARASRAVAALKTLGYENAKALAGGLVAWRAANLPVEKSAA